MIPSQPAPPGEWHPYYADRPWLRDWLNTPGRHDVGIAVARPMRLDLALPDPSLPVMRELVMTKRKAWALAPYVGRPFVYAWYVGVDNLGRQIAGDTRIVYTD